MVDRVGDVHGIARTGRPRPSGGRRIARPRHPECPGGRSWCRPRRRMLQSRRPNPRPRQRHRPGRRCRSGGSARRRRRRDRSNRRPRRARSASARRRRHRCRPGSPSHRPRAAPRRWQRPIPTTPRMLPPQKSVGRDCRQPPPRTRCPEPKRRDPRKTRTPPGGAARAPLDYELGRLLLGGRWDDAGRREQHGDPNRASPQEHSCAPFDSTVNPDPHERPPSLVVPCRCRPPMTIENLASYVARRGKT